MRENWGAQTCKVQKGKESSKNESQKRHPEGKKGNQGSRIHGGKGVGSFQKGVVRGR